MSLRLVAVCFIALAGIIFHGIMFVPNNTTMEFYTYTAVYREQSTSAAYTVGVTVSWKIYL